MLIEYSLLFLSVAAIIAVYYILKTVKHLVVNTLIGLAVLVVAKWYFGVGISITVPVVLVCAFGGLPGALLVILLHSLGIAFA